MLTFVYDWKHNNVSKFKNPIIGHITKASYARLNNYGLIMGVPIDNKNKLVKNQQKLKFTNNKKNKK